MPVWRLKGYQNVSTNSNRRINAGFLGDLWSNRSPGDCCQPFTSDCKDVYRAVEEIAGSEEHEMKCQSCNERRTRRGDRICDGCASKGMDVTLLKLYGKALRQFASSPAQKETDKLIEARRAALNANR
jgi:uncharacterized protein YecT (DUF1311 family)